MNYSQKEVSERFRQLKSPASRRFCKLRLMGAHILLISFLSALCFSVILAIDIFQDIVASAPGLDAIAPSQDGHATTLLDVNGNVFETLSSSDTEIEYVTYENIPSTLQNAFVATQDESYWVHNGVNYMKMPQTFFSGIINGGSFNSGSFTLTEQYLRNQVFAGSREDSPFKRFQMKLQEQYLAVQLSKQYDKRQVLEYYLNTVSLGQSTQGVQSASRRYFNKDVSDLTLSECAVLAATAQDPSNGDPVSHPAKNAKRFASVLSSMKEQGYITAEEYNDAMGDDVYSRIQNAGGDIQKSFFTDALISQVIRDLKDELGYTDTQAYNTLYRQGLTIYTTQDTNMQDMCDALIRIPQYYGSSRKNASADTPQVSVVVMDQSTGAVRAICGGWGEESRTINRATALTRQPGSLFQVPSTYVPALDTNGMTLATVHDDAKYNYPGTKIPVENWYGSSYRGLSSIRNGITDSMNVIAAKTLGEVTPKTGYDYLLNLGFTTITDTYTDSEGVSHTDISLPLASGKLTKGVTNLELTNAFAAIADGGTYHKACFYTKILDQKGNVLLENNQQGRQVMKESTAWLMTDAMKDVILTGTGTAAAFRHIDMPQAGMTGISEDNKDYWFVGYTPYLVTGVWIGCDDGSALSEPPHYAELWRDITEQLNQDFPEKKFLRPNSIISTYVCTKCGKLAIDDLCNRAVGGSCTKLEYFARDTAPTENCDCHVRCRICKGSGHLAGDSCPADDIYTAVYLQKKETSGKTADAPLILPEYLQDSVCEVHNH